MKNFFIFLLILLSPWAQADFSKALNDYTEGRHEQAYNQFLIMAKTGEKQSQFNLGVMYYQGQFVKQDINKAYAWIKLAADSDTLTDTEQNALSRIKNEITDIRASETEYQLLANHYSTQVLINKLYPEFVEPKNNNAFRAMPIKIVQPKYPRKAVMKGQQGWVRFLIDIDKQGAPRNIQLLEDFPENVFSKTSIKAISRWKFKISYDDNGNKISRKNLIYTMSFRLGKNDPLKLQKGIYEKNMEQALQGNPIAQFNIGYWEKKLRVSKGEVNPNEWFLKSAIKGHPLAQYELGKSLVFGQGCKLDKAKGVEWLTRSAHNGQSDAKQLFTTVASKVKTLESQTKATEYLQGLETLSPATQLSYAWMLATSPFIEIANPKKALSMINDFSYKTFSDDITLYEIQAAAYAAMGKFKKATSYQEDALDEAEDRKADVSEITERLAMYKNKQKWF